MNKRIYNKQMTLLKNDQAKRRSNSIISANSTLIDIIMNTGVNYVNDIDIDMILTDLTVTQCDVSRKAATEKKEIQIICDDEDIIKNFKEIFNPDIVSQVLETYLYGINVFEINYKQKDKFIYPRLIQRDFRQFKFNKNGVLVFNAGGTEINIPDYKVIYGLNRANFRKVYGDALLNKLYFPVKMKNASLKFWFRFLEKFGSPWAIAKTDYDPDELAKEVAAMLSGDSAVIDKEEELNLIQPTSNVDFTKLPTYLDNQISKSILGANLTSDVRGGSFAAAKTHNEIREDLASNDAKILIFVINRAIKFFKEINSIDIEISARLFDESAINNNRALRDKTIYDMGFIPTKDYISSTYNIELEEENIVKENRSIRANKQNQRSDDEVEVSKRSEQNHALYIDNIDKATDELKLDDKELVDTLNRFLSECDTYEDAFNKLYELYDLPYERIEKVMFNSLANARILGYKK